VGNQRTFASMAWSAKGKVTRRERFLAEMDAVIPWPRLLGLIEPHYPKAGNGRQPLGASFRPDASALIRQRQRERSAGSLGWRSSRLTTLKKNRIKPVQEYEGRRRRGFPTALYLGSSSQMAISSTTVCASSKRHPARRSSAHVIVERTMFVSNIL